MDESHDLPNTVWSGNGSRLSGLPFRFGLSAEDTFRLVIINLRSCANPRPRPVLSDHSVGTPIADCHQDNRVGSSMTPPPRGRGTQRSPTVLVSSKKPT